MVSSDFLRKRTVAMDAAYLLAVQKGMAAEPNARWVLVVSSPQKGRDWFQCKEQHAGAKDLVKLARTVDQLTRAKEHTDLHAEELAPANLAIQNCLHVHMKLPMAKGEGCSSLEHLTSCFAQACFFEAGSIDALQRHVRECISLTSDLGSDSGIRSFKVNSPLDVLPPWLHPQVEPVVLQPDLEAEGSFAECAEVSLVPVPFLNDALEIPGALHILSNLPRDLVT